MKGRKLCRIRIRKISTSGNENIANNEMSVEGGGVIVRKACQAFQAFQNQCPTQSQLKNR